MYRLLTAEDFLHALQIHASTCNSQQICFRYLAPVTFHQNVGPPDVADTSFGRTLTVAIGKTLLLAIPTIWENFFIENST